ncbi:MAG TPA: M3 family peptidase, partial [Geothrix sp.]
MSTTHIVRTALASTFFLALLPGHAGTPVPSSSQTPAMLSSWKGPYGGVPAWSEIQPAAFPAAFAMAMQAQRDALQSITANPRPATFANTILALEQSSELLDRVGILFGVHTSTLNLGVIPKVEQEMAPRLAAFSDEITQNGPLFKRIEQVHLNVGKEQLTPEQRRLTWLFYTNFVRSGAKLDGQQKAQLGALNQRLASLATQF